jgi:hypothetical protein
MEEQVKIPVLVLSRYQLGADQAGYLEPCIESAGCKLLSRKGWKNRFSV